VLDVCYAANSVVKIGKTTEVLEGAKLLELLNNMSDVELAELEDELNFAHFAGVYGPILSGITNDSNAVQQLSTNKAQSNAA